MARFTWSAPLPAPQLLRQRDHSGWDWLPRLAAAALAGVIVEIVVIRRLYTRDHLDQVLATFALILMFSEGTRWLFGSFPLYLNTPEILSGPITFPGGFQYPAYRLAIIVIGFAVAGGLFWLIGSTRLGIRDPCR